MAREPCGQKDKEPLGNRKVDRRGKVAGWNAGGGEDGDVFEDVTCSAQSNEDADDRPQPLEIFGRYSAQLPADHKEEKRPIEQDVNEIKELLMADSGPAVSGETQRCDDIGFRPGKLNGHAGFADSRKR